MLSKTFGVTATVAIAASFVVAAALPAHATSTSTRPLPTIGSEEQKDVLGREKVRRQQVRDNRRNGLFEPIFAPLFQGYNSPGQKVKRTFD
ncbi:hypothetical protein FHS55_002773 [Angulomicrobium tetraedrale]|uniref:Uncharacterized protein n=1 Tax=Ancylobacter tetraedralis TaxID=217068 RepID=A0A839ZBN8_9HYPH|nr:hypothetical protein [Ancylobacter tetraedralis]MBB3772161.1 hypothetical protein [Ancylobacter tetraedralis]